MSIFQAPCLQRPCSSGLLSLVREGWASGPQESAWTSESFFCKSFCVDLTLTDSPGLCRVQGPESENVWVTASRSQPGPRLCPGDIGDVWRYTWSPSCGPPQGWAAISGDQGCCSAPCNAQDRPHHKVSRAEVSTLVYTLGRSARHRCCLARAEKRLLHGRPRSSPGRTPWLTPFPRDEPRTDQAREGPREGRAPPNRG